MNKFKAITGFIGTIIKYGGIVYLVIETLQFFMDGLDKLEKPNENEGK